MRLSFIVLLIVATVILRPKRGSFAVAAETDTSDRDESRRNSRSRRNTTASSTAEDQERLKEQREARRRRKRRETVIVGNQAAKSMIDASSTEMCDWRKQPMSFLKGELCGSHYKVLGLDRRGKLPERTEIKKAYRQRSLEVHPDKNPSPEAETAFKIVQDAYECLSDDRCRREYERKLDYEEEQIALNRQMLIEKVVHKGKEIFLRVNYYLTFASSYVYHMCMEVWERAGEFEMEIFDEPRPIGKYLLAGLLFFKGRFALKIFGVAYSILRVNQELASNGFFDRLHGFY
jgi:preprotein translocase subunit Sec63